MQPKRSKYDTNPLDGNVAERADQDWGRDTGSRDDPPTQSMSGGVTSEIGRTSNEAARSNPETEAPTRRIDDSYRSVFAYGQSQATTYQPPRMPDANIYQPPPGPPPQLYQHPPAPAGAKPGSHKVAGLGIPEKWAVMLPYIPFFIAMIASHNRIAARPAHGEARAISRGAGTGAANWRHGDQHYSRICQFIFRQIHRRKFVFRGHFCVSDYLDDSGVARKAASHRVAGSSDKLDRG